MQKIKTKVDLPEPHKTVASLIRVGRKNATLLSDIMSIADIKDQRTAYKVIQDLINKYGKVIVASRSGKYKGYFYPANEMEFKKALRTFRSEYTSMIKRHNNLLTNYNKQSQGKEKKVDLI